MLFLAHHISQFESSHRFFLSVGQRGTWISFEQFAYWYSPPGDNRNITEAREICAQKYGSLAEVRTEEIQFFLNQTIRNDTGWVFKLLHVLYCCCYCLYRTSFLLFSIPM